MLIGLYTSRVVLNTLGVQDFGIYNVVGGVMAMFGIANTAMAFSTIRFLTFELGAGNLEKLKVVFSQSLLIHGMIALGVCALAETLGLWFLKTQMQIPLFRMEAAQWVFHCSVAVSFLSMINVPYNASIIAHEKMGVFANLSLLDISLKLGVVFLLESISYDKLKLYAVLLLIVQVIMRCIYMLYCSRAFEEVRMKFLWNKNVFKEMSSFAGWSLFGDAAAMMFTEGVNILLNILFGTVVNAARGIAIQVQRVFTRFISNFQMALNPQITKTYAANDLEYMHKLIYASSKYSFFLLLFLSLPAFIETKSLLYWWLKIVPDYTIIFVRIMILISFIDCLANPLIISAKATGHIKVYQSVLGTLLLLIVPLAYLALKLGYPPESVFIIHLAMAIIGHAVRVVLVRSMILLSLRDYFKKVIIRSGLVFCFAPLLPFLCYYVLPNMLFRFILVCLSSFFSVIVLVYLWGMDKQEKNILYNIIVNKYRKIIS
ncbi:lipopolysaccharide biosynthesis protein [uncultured Bacteroides sp.]|uniref:lipopolysaccharide biosynthesis protein n=1 Tax=uncultured Bacteroides sp. TaxID=162156 RepID=UPI002AAB976F|nr:lipopolysaccharide biosynthesis protein [uncultured Bacteroides sp.]